LSEFTAVLDGEQTKLLVHLLGCASCRERLLPLLLHHEREASSKPDRNVLQWRVPEPDYSPTGNAQTQERLILSLELERAEARGLFNELMAQPTERRALLIENSSRFHTWGFFELLIDKALNARPGGLGGLRHRAHR